MKILAIADTHISEHHALAGGNVRGSSGDRRSLEIARQALSWASEVARERDVDAVVHAGDVFDRSSPTPGEMNVARLGLAELIAGRPHVVLVGNHDLGYGNGVHALSPLAELTTLDGFNLAEAPKSVRVEDVEFFTLPYPDLGRFGGGGDRLERNARASAQLDMILADLAAAASQSTAAFTVLVSHVTFGGCAYNSGQLVAANDVRCSTTFLGVFDAVIAGHLHLRQPINGSDVAQYIGPPTRWSFNDEGNPAGVAILNTVTGEIEYVPNPGAPVFVTYDIRRGVDLDTAFEVVDQLAGHAALAFVRVVGEVENSADYAEVQRLAEALGDSALATCRNDVTVRADRTALEGVDVRDDLGLFEHYVASRPDAIPEPDVDEVRDEVRDVLEAVAS